MTVNSYRYKNTNPRNTRYLKEDMQPDREVKRRTMKAFLARYARYRTVPHRRYARYDIEQFVPQIYIYI